MHENSPQIKKKRRSFVRQLTTKSARGHVNKSLLHRLSTADFLPAFGLYRILLVRDLGETFSRRFRCLEEFERPSFSGRTVMLASNPAGPRLAAPSGAPTRAARGMSAFWIRQVRKINKWLCDIHFKPVESKTRRYRGRVESGRPAGRLGGIRQDLVPAELFAQKTSVSRTLQSIEQTSPERFSRSTNKQNHL